MAIFSNYHPWRLEMGCNWRAKLWEIKWLEHLVPMVTVIIEKEVARANLFLMTPESLHRKEDKLKALNAQLRLPQTIRERQCQTPSSLYSLAVVGKICLQITFRERMTHVAKQQHQLKIQSRQQS